MKRSTFRLYIFGKLNDYAQPMITFSEFKESRAVERIILDRGHINKLSQDIRKFHEFIECADPPLEPSSLRDLGCQLFNFIFQGGVKRLFDLATGGTRELLPFEIFVEDLAITGWPWEYLYDSGAKMFLCQEFHPISRGIFTLYSAQPFTPIEGKVRILLVIGVLPSDGATTPEAEIKWIREVVDSKLATESIEVDVMQAVGPEDIDKRLQRNSYEIFHFFGHARFDEKENEGYLKLERTDIEAYKYYANIFAQALAGKGLRLVFLNACETGKTSLNEDPARSSIAAAVLARGIPAVIATQFSIPDVSAHYLSSMIYNSLLTGKPLVDAMRDGRRAMGYAPKRKFFDWGIPVLYTSDPDLVIFPNPGDKPKPEWVTSYERAMQDKNILKALGNPISPNSPSLTVGRTLIPINKKRAKVRVALIDFDAKVAFLPDLAEQANQAQHYYNFQIAYLPIPSAAITMDVGTEVNYPQLYLPLLEEYLVTIPEDLNVDKVCCLTRCRIAGKLDDGTPFANYRASALNLSEDVITISTYKLRDYARQAAVPYAKATLYISLAMIVATDQRWEELIHHETVGCLFDDCENRDDLVLGLKMMSFDHAKCREKIKDQEQLDAITALVGLQTDRISQDA